MASGAFRLDVVAAAACRPDDRISTDVRFCGRIRKIEQLLFPMETEAA
jgi:hypothetical protein